jgi:hypothetical protein
MFGNVHSEGRMQKEAGRIKQDSWRARLWNLKIEQPEGLTEYSPRLSGAMPWVIGQK